MLNNGVVTIFRADERSKGLRCLGTVPAWVNHKQMVRGDGVGTNSDDRFDVRIDLRHLEDVRAGDFIFFGRAESSCAKVSECRRIESVTKNEYGTAAHWHLATEYRYR